MQLRCPHPNYGPQRLELACKKANALGMVGQRRLRSMLKTGLESDPLCVELADGLALTHANVRGQTYYTSP